MKHRYMLTFRERIEYFPGMRGWHQQQHELELEDEEFRELNLEALVDRLKDKSATLIGQVGLTRAT